MTRRPRRLVLHILAAATFICASRCVGVGADAPMDSISTRCNSLASAGRHGEIESLCRTRLDVPSTDSLEIATLNLWLGYSLAYQGKGKGGESVDLARRGCAIRGRHLPASDPAIADGLLFLADIRTRLADYDGVDSIFRHAVAIRESAFGARHPKVARALANYAIFLKNTGELDRARETYERSLSIEREALGPDDPSVARTLYNLGNLMVVAGEPRGAEREFREAIAICERSPTAGRLEIARYRLGLASALVRSHKVIEAREQIAEAISVYEAELSRDHPSLIEAIAMLASIMREIGDVEQADPLMARAFQGYEKRFGPDHPKLAQILAEWARIRLEEGDLDGAIEMSRRSLAIREGALGEKDLATAFALSELAGLYLRRGDLTSADSLAARSIAVQSAILGPDSLASPLPLLTRAECLRNAGRAEEADRLLDAAEEVVRRTVGEHHPSYDACLQSRVRLLMDAGESTEALAFALESLAFQRGLIRSIARGLPERQALQYLKGIEPAQDLVLSLIVRHPENRGARGAAWTGLIASRALVLDEMAARRQAIAASDRADSAHGQELRELADLTRELAWMLTSAPEPVLAGGPDGRFAATRARQEDLERQLARDYAAAAPSSSPAEISPAAIGASLPRGSALVSYFRYRSAATFRRGPAVAADSTRGSSRTAPDDSIRYAAMIVHPQSDEIGPVDLVDLGRADDIELRIARWRDEAEAGTKIPGRTPAAAETFYRQAGSRLRESIWDPIAPLTAGDSVIFVIPDGEVALVDPATLPIGEDRYVIDGEQRIHTATTERDLIDRGTAAQHGEGLLAIGAPDFDTSMTAGGDAPSPSVTSGASQAGPAAQADRGALPSCEEFAKVIFGPLPGAAREVDEVVGLWDAAQADDRGDVARLVGAEASEGSFKALAARRRILHIASHGFFLAADCGHSGSGTRGVGGVAPSRTGRSAGWIAYNPLLLSGVALAGANLRTSIAPGTEDGILTAAEISEIDLSGTQWAVLSACDTGLGTPYACEGVLGLRRGFQIAGAQTIIMSLWSVDDQIVRDWMARLYRARLDGGLSAPDAMHEASHGILQERRKTGASTHPYFWAGFIAAGNWR